eukprot:GFUD01040793.1.p1 GENE.GFUD01040793.1~~GFUD01040793.1.p1  ORF type:complete len:157 (+),score=27.02 GFUD01040793.1:26-496(+)
MMLQTERGYCSIPDYILDGIHPDEDSDNVEETALEDDLVEDDQVGRRMTFSGERCCQYKQEAGDTEEKEVKLNLCPENHFQPINTKMNSRNNPDTSAAKHFLLSYANHHISCLFIIVLFLATLVCPGYSNIVITVIIIIVITALDNQYDMGIANIL